MHIVTLFHVLATINHESVVLPEEEPDEREALGFEKIKRDVFFVDSLYAGQSIVKKVTEHPLYFESCDFALMRKIVNELFEKEENLSLQRWVVSCIRNNHLERIYVALVSATE